MSPASFIGGDSGSRNQMICDYLSDNLIHKRQGILRTNTFARSNSHERESGDLY